MLSHKTKSILLDKQYQNCEIPQHISRKKLSKLVKSNLSNNDEDSLFAYQQLADKYQKKALTKKARQNFNNISRKNIKYLYRRDKRKCYLCKKFISLKRHEVTIDHVLPISKYPEMGCDFNNLKICCLNCNQNKADKIL